MDSRQKIAALIDAQKNGTEPPAWARMGSGVIPSSSPLNNLNSKASNQFKSPEDSSSYSNLTNLNNLRPEQVSKGIARIELYTDETLKKALVWGVEEWLLQVCIRDYGLYTVKAQINRIYQMPDGYFKPKYGPIPQQRGRIFNKEMQKLKQNKQSGRKLPHG